MGTGAVRHQAVTANPVFAKVSQRLRRHALTAQKYFVGLRTRDGWLGSNKLKTRFPTNDSRPLIELCKTIVYGYWHGEGVYQVQVTALDPRPDKGQLDMFSEEENRFHRLNRVLHLLRVLRTFSDRPYSRQCRDDG